MISTDLHPTHHFHTNHPRYLPFHQAFFSSLPGPIFKVFLNFVGSFTKTMPPPKKWGNYLPAIPSFVNNVESELTFYTDEEEESGSEEEETGRIAPRVGVKKKWDDEESEEEVYSPSYPSLCPSLNTYPPPTGPRFLGCGRRLGRRAQKSQRQTGRSGKGRRRGRRKQKVQNPTHRRESSPKRRAAGGQRRRRRPRVRRHGGRDAGRTPRP